MLSVVRHTRVILRHESHSRVVGRRRIATSLALTIVLSTAGFARAALGDLLDSTFGHKGKVTTDIRDRALDEVRAVAVQPDGKIVAVGFSRDNLGDVSAVARYLSDGTLDATFGGTGKVTGPLTAAEAVAVQNDGKILVVGSLAGDFATVRYTVDGELDATFGGTGTVVTSVGSFEDGARSVAVQADGKIVVTGYTRRSSSPSPPPADDSDVAVVRYDGGGVLDPTFGGGGIVIPALAGGYMGSALGVQTDGKIVVGAGRIVVGLGIDAAFTVLRYDEDGTLDATFGGTGIVSTSIGTMDALSAVTVQADGKIVAAGFSDAGPHGTALIRLSGDGTLDTTFGDGGKVLTPLGDAFPSIASLPDGRVVVVGSSGSNGGSFGDYEFAALRYLADGTLDQTFGGTGFVTNRIGPGFDEAFAVAVQADGKIVAAGYAEIDHTLDFALVRYNQSGSLSAPCDNSPAATCIGSWLSGSLTIDERKPGKEKFQLKMTRGATLSAGPSGVGDPTVVGGTAYTMCVYDEAGDPIAMLEVDRAGSQCAGAPCWKAAQGRYRYKDAGASSHGIARIDLKTGSAGDSKVQIKGANNAPKGQTELPLGIASSLSGADRATAQLFGSDTVTCVELVTDDVRKADGLTFKANQ